MIALLVIVGVIAFLTWRNWNRTEVDTSDTLIWVIKIGITLLVAVAIVVELIPMFRMGGISAALALPVFALGMAVLAAVWVPGLLRLAINPFTAHFDGGNVQVEARPQLSRVHGKRMQGRHDEAIEDVREQLERFPTDFEAQMLLAELLVECKGDFDAGIAVLETILAQPHPPVQMAAALNTLADWQLKHRSDSAAARAALERIVAAFPDDVVAAKAAQRITHLPSREELASRAGPKVLILEHVEDYIKPGGGRAPVGIAQEQTAEERAEQLSARLRQFPQDTEAREQLALLYADEYGQLEWAADQIEQLIRLPHQPDREVIRWLELLASMQRRHHDLAASARAYQRIIQMFPNHPGAERARGQLALMAPS
jgi:protein involved in temperature-dependent protein secretion